MTELAQYLKAQAPDRPVAEVLADILRALIMDGTFLPGERLVEADICKLYGVSRGPVREALRRLLAEGLLDAEKHRSPTVRGIDKEQFAQTFQVRGVLEGYAAALAAKNVTDIETAAMLREEAARWRAGSYSQIPSEFVEANTRFHSLVMNLAAHQLLAAQIGQLAIPGYKAVFAPLIQADDMELSAHEHAAVLDSIAAGEAEKAEAALRTHVHRSGARIAASYSSELFDRRLRELERLRGHALI